MSSALPNRFRVFVAYVTCFVTWGSTWSVIKIGLEDLPPLRFAGMRMLLAGLVLLPIARPWSGKVSRGDLKMLVQVGLLQICLPFGLMFLGQQWIPSSWAALLFSTFPVWLLLVARALLPGHALTALNVLSAILGVAGVAVMQVDQLHAESFGNAAAVGGALILAAAAISGVANVLARKHLTHVSTALAVCVQTLASGVLLLAASVMFERGQPSDWTVQSVAALVYLALGATVATYQLLYWLLPRVSLPAIGAIPLLDTLVAVTIGVTLLGERVTLTMVMGGGLILTGAALANLLPGSAKPLNKAA